MKFLQPLGAALAAACLIAAPAAAQQIVSAGSLTAESRQDVVAAAAEALRQGYVDIDLGEEAAAAIEDALAAGEYDGVTDPGTFASRLEEDLQAVSRDKHMRVAVPGARRPLPPGPIRPAPPPAEGGVARADILDGNIGYIELSAFPGPNVFGPPADRAMAELADTRALIVDVRRHGGGSPASEAHFISYFVDAGEPVEVTRIVWRNTGTDTFRTQNYFSAETPFSYAGKPVYVLTSQFTFSGAEALAYDMQALDLATVVGEVTGGGANPGNSVRLGSNFMINVPSGRAENPITEANWEGTGVTPDIAAPADQALRTALAELGVETDQTEIEALSEARVFTPRP